MIACLHLPRFELTVAAGERTQAARQALAGRALAVAPLAGSEQRLGEVSGAAEACGVRRGMLLGEALARCPELVLLPPDPVSVGARWEELLAALEAIGAAVEPARPGLAYFQTDGLEGLHGGRDATLAAAREAVGRAGRIGGGPTRFCALAAALAVRSRRPLVLEGPPSPQARRWLAGRPVELLGFREETAALLAPLRRLGVRTLGELARLGRAELADRFGTAGVLAHRLACGEDAPLSPRLLEERLEEWMEVGDASSGTALERVLGVLVDRLLARPERRGRTLRAVTLSARLLAGGGWRERVVFRQALADPERIRLALSLRLLLLPAPASALQLAVERFGPPTGEQAALLEQEHAARMVRLREAVAQMRAVAGPDAALRSVCVDPHSRVPERRVVLAPIPE
jgi:nucleotidyltransferase/DNA polymerase involved in DNA repair